MSIHNLVAAQDYKLTLKLDSTDVNLDSLKTKKLFNSKNQLVDYLDSISNNLILKGYIHNYYELKEENHITTASFKLFSKTDTIQISVEKIKYDFSKINTPIISQTSNYIELSTENTLHFLNELTTSFEKLGNSFSKVRLINLILKDSKIHAALTIKISPKRQIDDIIIKGYPEVSKKQLRKILYLNNKGVFNVETLKNIEKTVNTISFAEQTKPPEVLFTKDSTILYLYLKKKSSNHINGIVGFSTNDKNKITLNGDLDLQLSNIFNNGESFNINWKSYGSNTSLRTHLNLPILFTPQISFKGNFNLTKQDTLYTTSQGKLNLIYNLNKFHSIGGIVDFENSNLTNITPLENLNNYKKNGFGVTYSFSTLNNNSNIPLYISLSYLKGKKNKVEKLENLNLTVENTFKLSEKNNIYLKLTGQLLNSSNLSENELFKIGGYNSLRGFDEFSIYTSKYIISNIEYRYFLNEKNFFYSITDLAFTNSTHNLEKKSLLGLGIGYLFTANNSILNFSYVSGTAFNRVDKMNNSKIYLNISYLF